MTPAFSPSSGARSARFAAADRSPSPARRKRPLRVLDGHHRRRRLQDDRRRITWAPVTDKYFGGTIGAIARQPSRTPTSCTSAAASTRSAATSRTATACGRPPTAARPGRSSASGHAADRARARPSAPIPTSSTSARSATSGRRTPSAACSRSTDGGKTWRQDSLSQRLDRRRRSRDGSDEPERALRRVLAGGAHAVDARRPAAPAAASSRSTDGGEHWTELTRNPGLPAGSHRQHRPRGVAGEAESRVGDHRGRFGRRVPLRRRRRDVDATNDDRKLRQRAWYYTRSYADPKDTNIVYVLNNVSFYRVDRRRQDVPSRSRVPHGDNHDLWIAPNDPKRMIEANDGGANVSINGGRTLDRRGLRDGAVLSRRHDERTSRTTSAARSRTTPRCAGRAEAGRHRHRRLVRRGRRRDRLHRVAPRRSRHRVTPAATAGCSRARTCARASSATSIRGPTIRWATRRWTRSTASSGRSRSSSRRTTRTSLYAASQRVFQHDERRQSWTAISPDLTRHDPATLGPSGGPITKDQTSVEYYATIFAIAESPVRARADLDRLATTAWCTLTRDGGKTWNERHAEGHAEFTRISIIEASHARAGTAYVAANRYQLDDMRPYLYKTTDYGTTWTQIDNGIAARPSSRASSAKIRSRRGLLYAGTERGVWVSFDDGAHWQSLQLESAAGAGARSRDQGGRSHRRDARPLLLDSRRPLGAPAAHPAIPADGASVQAARQCIARVRRRWRKRPAGSHPTGANPPNGGVVYYWLSQPRQLVTLDFLDSQGKVIRSFTSQQDPRVAADSIRPTASAPRATTAPSRGRNARHHCPVRSTRRRDARSDDARRGAPSTASRTRPGSTCSPGISATPMHPPSRT